MKNEKENFESIDPAINILFGPDFDGFPELDCSELANWLENELNELESAHVAFITPNSLSSSLKRGR